MPALNIREEPDIPVAWVKAAGGPETYPEAFNMLESRMPTLRGRRMYGVFRREAASDYFAAVRLDDVQTDDMGFEARRHSGRAWCSPTMPIATSSPRPAGPDGR